jgi:hypothetical protein
MPPTKEKFIENVIIELMGEGPKSMKELIDGLAKKAQGIDGIEGNRANVINGLMPLLNSKMSEKVLSIPDDNTSYLTKAYRLTPMWQGVYELMGEEKNRF